MFSGGLGCFYEIGFLKTRKASTSCEKKVEEADSVCARYEHIFSILGAMQWVNQRLLKSLLQTVTASPHSDFYTKKYAAAGIAPEDVLSLPLSEIPALSRAELVETPLEARTYTKPADVRFAAFTSGTSSSNPLIALFADVPNYFFEPSLGLAVTRPLIIYPPLNKNFSHTFVQQCRQAAQPVSPMFGDFQQLSNSAVLAAAVGCDSIYATPTIAGLFAEHAKRLGIAEHIRLLALCSETLTEAQRESLNAAYPNALIANLYASSEIGQFVFFPCEQMMREGKNNFHVLTDAVAAVELVEGELLISYGLNAASPLVRYRTGDYFEEVASGCSCGRGGPVLSWLHREQVDRVRLNGIEFDAEAADRAFSGLPHLLSRYQVHLHAAMHSPALVVVVEITDPVAAAEPERQKVLAEFVEAELLDNWKLAPGASMRTALERGLVGSFSVSVVPEFSSRSIKSKRFINHVR